MSCWRIFYTKSVSLFSLNQDLSPARSKAIQAIDRVLFSSSLILFRWGVDYRRLFPTLGTVPLDGNLTLHHQKVI